ncbi:MAG TPA: NAD-dependent epimerase/dehydratase family protein [Blastocatellia bacterium]|nr:NAD-dependent epimerase/dehydratase family protein [Blastocatellia bacterium]
MESNGPKKALVTGATGFIGGRLTERLLAEGISVRALVREFDKAAWLAARGAELVAGDVTEPDTLPPAFESCQLVFHCAALMHDAQVPADEYRRVNVQGVEHMLEAASRAELERFVYVSSIAVYGISPKKKTTEADPHELCGIPYIDTKVEAEEIAFRYCRENRLPLVVIRPANVYGPRSRAWTVWLVEMIKSGRVFLIDDGCGMSNEVYIDNLIEALLLAARSERAVGEAFIISDGAQTNWREFLGHYAQMLGRKLHSVPRSQAVEPPYNLSLLEADLWTQSGSFDITKARTLLGYAPRISLAEGMRLTEQWLRAAGYI